MVNKVGRSPRFVRPSGRRTPSAQELSKYDAAQNAAQTRQQTDVAARLNLAVPNDGSEAFEAPVPTQNVATVDLPAAADWEGGVVYDSTTSQIKYSDGASWITLHSGAVSISGTTQQNVTLSTPIVTGLLTLSGGQIAFPATQVASTGANVLDDYEEGTWTPAFSATAATFNYSIQGGFYQKIGPMVTVLGKLVLASGGTLTANPISLTGLPFVVSTGGFNGVASCLFSNTTTSYIEVKVFTVETTTTCAFGVHTAAATSNMTTPNANALCSSGGTLIAFTLTYLTTS